MLFHLNLLVCKTKTKIFIFYYYYYLFISFFVLFLHFCRTQYMCLHIILYSYTGKQDLISNIEEMKYCNIHKAYSEAQPPIITLNVSFHFNKILAKFTVRSFDVYYILCQINFTLILTCPFVYYDVTVFFAR